MIREHSIVLFCKQYANVTFESFKCNEHSKTTLLEIKVLHDAIEEPLCLNGSIKNL